MKNLKTTILTVIIAICCFTNVNAQENGSSGTYSQTKKASSCCSDHTWPIISIGGGTSLPSSDIKDNAFLSNTTAINADFYFPLIRKGWDGGGARDHVKGHKMNFGLNVGGTYNFGGSGGFGTTPNPFAVTGQTSSMVSDRGAEAAPGFRMGAGPQANFYFGKFIVSPMVLGEYFSMTQKEMSIMQTTQFNGQSYDFNLATLPETKTSGFAVTPKLRLHYMINDRFGLFADASYTMGPKIETNVSKLIPNGNPSPQSGSYTIQQLETGTMVKGETKSTTYSALGFNFGVVIGLGSKIKNGSNNADLCTVCGQESWGGLDHPNCKGKANTDDIRKGWNGLADAPEELEPTTPSNARTINNCCDATVTGSIQWDRPGGAFSLVTATPSLGSYTMASISGGIVFNSTISCLTYSGCADPFPIKYKVNGVLVGTVANTTNFTIPASAFPSPGGYTITVIGMCGGSKCKAKQMQITIL